MPNPVPQIQMINHQQHDSQRHQHYIQVPCLPPHLHHRVHSTPLTPTSKPSKITHNSSNLRISATFLLLLKLFETLKVSRKRVFQCLRCDAKQSHRQWLLAGIRSLRLARPDAFLADHFCAQREGGRQGGRSAVRSSVAWRGMTGCATCSVTGRWLDTLRQPWRGCDDDVECHYWLRSPWRQIAVNLRREGWRFGWGFIDIGHSRALHEH